MPHVVAGLLWVVLFPMGAAGPGVAWAAEGPDVVVAGEPSRVVAELNARSFPLPGAHVETLDELVAGFGLEPELHGNVRIRRCEEDEAGPVPDGDALDELLARAARASEYQEYAELLRLAGEFERSLPCIGFVPAGDRLVELLYYRATARFHERQINRAADAFSDLLAVAPDYTWSPSVSPEPKPLFEEVRAGLGEQAPARLLLHADPTELELAALDGRILSPADPAPRTLLPGLHLLQWKEPKGPLRSALIDAAAGSEIHLTADSGRRRALRTALTEGGFSAWLSGRLLIGGVERPIVFVDLTVGAAPGDAPGWRFDPAVGGLSPLPTRSELRRERRSRRDDADIWGAGRDRFRLAVSLGYGRTGARPNQNLERGYDFGMVSASQRLRIRGPVRLEIALQLALGSNAARLELNRGESPVRTWAGLRLGPSFALNRNRLEAEVGIQVVLESDRPEQRLFSVWGGRLRFGADFLLAKERGLFVHFEAGASLLQVWALDSAGKASNRAYPGRFDVSLGLGWRR